MRSYPRESSLKKLRYLHAYDVAACVFFLLIIGRLLYMVRTGLGPPDEAFYITIPHRLLQGDRLILDDWHVSQFSSFMQFLPVKWYFNTHGSLDGVILCFRYLYIVLQAATLLLIYPMSRRLGWKGVVAWAVFGMYVPILVCTLNYYTLCLWPSVIVCVYLHFAKKLKPPVLVLLGILLSLAVLAEPLAAACFFLYTLLVWLRFFVCKKYGSFLSGYAYFINMRCWVFITIGVFLCAAVYLQFLFRNSDVQSTLEAIPYLFNGYEYDFSNDSGNVLTFGTVKQAMELYGRFPVVLLAALTGIALMFRRYIGKIRPLIVVGLTVGGVYAFSHAAYMASTLNRIDYCILFNGLPLYLCGPVVYQLLEKRDKRLFAFWCSGALLSVCLDISSAIVLGVCGSISAIASLIWLFQLAEECANRMTQARKNGGKTVAGKKWLQPVTLCFVVVFLVAAVFSEAAFDVYSLNFNAIETWYAADFSKEACNTLLTRGAYAGVRTTRKIAAKYNATLDDLDYLSSHTSGPVLIYDLCPYCYLYLNKPYATYSAWYVDVFEDDRLLLYYEVHPEKTPAYVYVPKYDPYTYRAAWELQDKLVRIQRMFPCEITEGDAGYFVRVLQ